tara:strand:- start:73 stop:234 length:162 start_codon:yes stop_codon:yes gene_type:complete
MLMDLEQIIGCFVILFMFGSVMVLVWSLPEPRKIRRQKRKQQQRKLRKERVRK